MFTVRLSERHVRSRLTWPAMTACLGIGSRDGNHLLCQPGSMDESFGPLSNAEVGPHRQRVPVCAITVQN